MTMKNRNKKINFFKSSYFIQNSKSSNPDVYLDLYLPLVSERKTHKKIDIDFYYPSEQKNARMNLN